MLLRLPIACRTRLTPGLAGSATVTATAATDFDIRRSETSFATVGFTAAADTASFLAASETVPEPGDVLTVVAPATPDATLAELGFALAGTLVV